MLGRPSLLKSVVMSVTASESINQINYRPNSFKLYMKLTPSSNRFDKEAIPTSSEIPQSPDPNPNFSDNYLRQQVFYKPKPDNREPTSQDNYKDSSLNQNPKRPTNGMGNSFMSGHSNTRVRTKQQQSYKKMIIQLSHELLVKDSMIETLRCELMSSQSNESPRRGDEEQRQVPTKNKSSYHFKTLIENRAGDKDIMPRKKSVGGFSNDEKRVSQVLSLEDKATLSESQFVKVYGKDSEDSFQRKPESSRLNPKKLGQKGRVSQLQETLKAKDKQIQVILSEKKLLTQKLVQNQRSIISKDLQIKSLRSQLKRGDISKDQINKSIDSKRSIEYQQRINRLRKQTLFLTAHIQQIKKSKGEQIQSSIREWKKINQTMTDSLVKLNQENSILTKKMADLEIRLNTSCTKTSELEKQNSTLKYNLENEKNSYSTLSMHHRHEKDESGRRVGQLEKDLERMRQRVEKEKGERERGESGIREKVEALRLSELELSLNTSKYQSEIANLKESHTEQLKHQKELKLSVEKDLQVTLSSLKSAQSQLLKERQYKSTIQKQLSSTIKSLSQYKTKESEKNQQLEHYKNKVSELIQKVSELKIEKDHQRGKDSKQGSERDMEREETLFENQTLKYKIEELTRQMNQDPEESVKRLVEDLGVEVEKRQGLEEVNRKLGEKIRRGEQEILSLKAKIKEGEGNTGSNPNNQMNHHLMSIELSDRDHIIYDLKQSLRRQQDNTISVKLHLNDVNKKLNTITDLLDLSNRSLIQKQFQFGSCMLEAEEVIEQLKQDNEQLQKELKVIYERLEYFEQKLECESSEIDNDNQEGKKETVHKLIPEDRMEGSQEQKGSPRNESEQYGSDSIESD